MNDLVTWLRAQFDREEQDARLIPGGGYQPARWIAHRVQGGEWAEIRQHDLVAGETIGQEGTEVYTAGLMVWGRNEDQHVSRWDPTRIAAEVEAKRRILELHHPDGELENWFWLQRTCAECGRPWHRWIPDRLPTDIGPEVGCPTLRLLALPYADQPGYREEWRPTA